jgi:hypothetical protein
VDRFVDRIACGHERNERYHSRVRWHSCRQCARSAGPGYSYNPQVLLDGVDLAVTTG